mgnify:CR=1 FL=1
MTELVAKDVCISVGGKALVTDANASLRGGELVAVLGPNGAGKTTLTRVLAGILEPGSGSVMLDGEAVAEAIKAAAPPGIPVRVFMGIHHDGYTERSRPFIEDSLHWDSLDGLDLHGTETTPLEPWTAGVWRRARESGKQTKAHAGEFNGPEFVWQVVEELGVMRIEHGVRSIESPKLVRHLADIGAVLDVCPISNIKLGVVERMSDHPVRDLMREGVTCTLSTDDPISFGNTLTEEYTALYQDLGCSFRELGQLAANGFRHAIDGRDNFSGKLDEIEQLVAEFENRE